MKINEITNSGCYMITNTINGKIYIGSSENINKRWNEHKNMLLKNKHDNNHLQAAYNKYGIGAFEYIIIRYCDKEDCLFFEQIYLDTYWDGGNLCYNIAKDATAPMKGRKHSEGFMVGKNNSMFGKSSSMLGKHHTTETKNKISSANIGKNNGMFSKTGELCPSFGKLHTEKQKAACSGKNNPMFGRTGEKNPSAKLTWKQVKEIRLYYKEGITRVDLAKKYGVSFQNISSILNNKIWKEVQ